MTDLSILTKLIHRDGDRLFITSLEISNRFGKQHKNVLDAIRNLECSEEFNRLNFRLIEYNDGRGRNQPMYQITRDGFVLLAMGFTGREAMLWKERYIMAFGLMEKALTTAQPQAVATISTDSLDLMARNMAKLAEGMDALLRQNNRTDRYVALLEINQKGHVKVTEEVRQEVFGLYGEGMPQASIARLLRISAATVNQLIKGTYMAGVRSGIPVGQNYAEYQAELDAAIERKLAEAKAAL